MGVVEMGKTSHGGSQLMKPEGLYGHTPDFTPMGHPHPGHPSGPPSRAQMGSHMGHHPHVHHPGFGPGPESMFEPLTPSNAPGMPLGPVASMAEHHPHHVSNIAVSSAVSSSSSSLAGHHATSPHSPGGGSGAGHPPPPPPPPHPHQMYTPMYSAAPVNPHHPHHHHHHHPHHLPPTHPATMHHPHHHHHHHHQHHPGLVGVHGLGAGTGGVGSLGTGADSDCDPRELEMFAERFKQRRIKLGVTQADVGAALANLKIPGVGCLSQSTICRFESLTLSHNNMIALKPILMAWLEDAERQARERKADPSAEEKKRKRTSIAAPEKRSLEAYFAVQPRPSGEKIAQIAEKLDLKKNVVRVWFCNQRQKQKRMKFSATALSHH